MQVVTDAVVSAAPHFNEAEIRFHILDPVVRMLGYPDTKDTYLNLEEKLEYPYVHIGRRSKRDVPLGYPDYRAGVKGARGSFIVEAKSGNVPITSIDVEQAHSYAAHAQVGANFFMLGNGTELSVYATLSGPSAEPLLRLPLKELNNRFFELENILAPANLVRNCRVEYDKKLQLAGGLGSHARVRSGRYKISDHDLRILANGHDCTALIRQSVQEFAEAEAQLELLKSSFEMQLSDGFVERADDGKIVAHVEFKGVTIHNQAAMQILGVDQATFSTADKFLSTTPDSPTIFESLTDFSVSRGTFLPQLFGGAAEMEGDLLGSMFIQAAMHYREGVILGEYIAVSDQDVSIPNQAPIRFEIDVAGNFELQVDARESKIAMPSH